MSFKSFENSQRKSYREIHFQLGGLKRAGWKPAITKTRSSEHRIRDVYYLLIAGFLLLSLTPFSYLQVLTSLRPLDCGV